MKTMEAMRTEILSTGDEVLTGAVATSGIAGPGGGTAEKPVGTVCLALAGHGGVKAVTRLFSYQNRLGKKQLFAWAALDLLRRELE